MPSPRARGGAVLTGSIRRPGDQLERLSRQAASEQPARTPFVVLRPGRPRFTVAREDGGWRVSGRNVERWVRETDLDDERQLTRLQRRLIKEGVERQLAKAGARRGDEIRISDRAFEFLPDADPPANRAEG